MARAHEREQQVDVASSELASVMCRELEKHDLTDAEWLRAVHHAYSTLVNGYIKTAIRVERHGDQDIPGGWAT
jgi:hypothetical protein